jgi:hypothetical protein
VRQPNITYQPIITVFHWLLISFTALSLCACATGPNDHEEQLNKQLEDLAANHGIFVFFKGDPLRFFHPSWKNPPVSVRAEALSHHDKKFVITALKKALSIYPPSFVSKHIGAIVLLKKFSLYGYGYGGTYTVFKTPGYNLLYLSKGKVSDEDFVNQFIDSFHHEFSSVLMQMHNFPEKEWRAVNGKSFKYNYEGEESPGFKALQNDDISSEFSIHMVRHGFLSEYAMSGIEEDFNVFAAVALKDPEWMSELAVDHPKIHQKLQLMLNFYLKIDKGFAKSEPFKFYQAKGLLKL